jgi:hypothetical protein
MLTPGLADPEGNHRVAPPPTRRSWLHQSHKNVFINPRLISAIGRRTTGCVVTPPYPSALAIAALIRTSYWCSLVFKQPQQHRLGSAAPAFDDPRPAPRAAPVTVDHPVRLPALAINRQFIPRRYDAVRKRPDWTTVYAASHRVHHTRT